MLLHFYVLVCNHNFCGVLGHEYVFSLARLCLDTNSINFMKVFALGKHFYIIPMNWYGYYVTGRAIFMLPLKCST